MSRSLTKRETGLKLANISRKYLTGKHQAVIGSSDHDAVQS